MCDTSDEQYVGLISNTMEARQEHQQFRRFNALYGVAFGTGIVLVGLVVIWCAHYRGGFAWPTDDVIDKDSVERAKQFNWHPLLMTCGMIFLNGNSILIYRSRRFAPKRQLKLIHAGIHITIFVTTVVALQAVFDFHNYTAKPNLYSLHSWFGLSTVVLFAMQLLGGFVTFLYPGASNEIRATILPVHTALGIGIFILSVISAMTGLMEKILFSILPIYSTFPSEGIFSNFIGLVLAFFAILVLYLVNDATYKRQTIEEDQVNLHESTILE